MWADPAGGAYAAPRLRALAGEGPYDPAMALPGIKVLHVQDYDYRTTCLSLAACLQEVKAWSDAHPGHVPLAILIELKDTALTPPIPATIPLPWTSVPMDALDAEIRAVFPPERLIVPGRRARPPPHAGGRRPARRLADARGEPRQGAVPDGQRRALPRALPAGPSEPARAGALHQQRARPARRRVHQGERPVGGEPRPDPARGAARLRRPHAGGRRTRARPAAATRAARGGRWPAARSGSARTTPPPAWPPASARTTSCGSRAPPAATRSTRRAAAAAGASIAPADPHGLGRGSSSRVRTITSPAAALAR